MTGEELLQSEKITNRLFIEVINAKKNQEYLKDKPYELKAGGELAAVAKVWVLELEGGSYASIPITNYILCELNMDKEALFQKAWENTPSLFPPAIKSIEKVMQNLRIVSKEELQGNLLGTQLPIYVLTNTYGVSGAAVMFYPDIMEQIARELGEYPIIIPSSVHETLIIDADDTKDSKEIFDIIQKLNQECVSEKEVLADVPFRYDFLKKEIVLEEDFKKSILPHKKNIVEFGLKPSRELIHNMRVIEAHMGRFIGLKEVSEMSKIYSKEVNEAIRQIATEGNIQLLSKQHVLER